MNKVTFKWSIKVSLCSIDNNGCNEQEMGINIEIIIMILNDEDGSCVIC